MSNTALISFRLPPEKYAVVKALADAAQKTISEFCRDTVDQAHSLDAKAGQLASFFGADDRISESHPPASP